MFSPGDRSLFSGLVDNMLHSDYFCVLPDFDEYIKCQERVGEAFLVRPSRSGLAAFTPASAGANRPCLCSSTVLGISLLRCGAMLPRATRRAEKMARFLVLQLHMFVAYMPCVIAGPRAVDEDGRSQHSQLRQVLVRSHHRRVCTRHLGGHACHLVAYSMTAEIGLSPSLTK